MKKILISFWLKAPFKWFRKIRGFRLVYTPLLAIVIFTAVMGVILGTLQLQEKNQQEAALFRELSFAKQRIQLRFSNNTDLLTAINRDYVSNYDQDIIKGGIVAQIQNLLLNNREIAQVLWLDLNMKRQWQVPATDKKLAWSNQPPGI